MQRREFEKIVAEEVDRIPERFLRELGNVVFTVERKPTRAQLRESDVPEGETLLGLFEGIMRGEEEGYAWRLPNRIIVFQEPTEEEAREAELDVRAVVRETVWHEVAHYLGMDEEEVIAAEDRRRGKRKE